MSSEYHNESRIHNTNDQCYEFWVHSDIPSSLRSPGNDENLSYTSPTLDKKRSCCKCLCTKSPASIDNIFISFAKERKPTSRNKQHTSKVTTTTLHALFVELGKVFGN